MVSAIYMSVLTFIIIWLTLNVIKTRRKHKILYGDGDNKELIIARSAQSNACQYIPITMVLLFTLEYNQANVWLLHILGIGFTVGRVIHLRGFLAENMAGRVLGMQLTLYSMLGLAIANLIYLPFGKILG